MRMVVPKIVRIHLLQPRIPLSPLPHPILPPHQNEQRRTSCPTNPQQAQTNSIPCRILRTLTLQKYIRRDDAANVTEADLECGGDGALVVPRHGVGEPDERDGLCDVAAGDDEEEGKVLDACAQMLLVQKQNVSHRRNNKTDHAERIAVLHAVRNPRRSQRRHRRNDKNWDRADLRGGGRVAEVLDDGRNEEGAGVPRVDDAEVHEGAEVDFGVVEDAFEGAGVKAVHGGGAGVGGEAGEEEGALGGGEEGCGFGPVGYLGGSVVGL
jgi:hypothetical protein